VLGVLQGTFDVSTGVMSNEQTAALWKILAAFELLACIIFMKWFYTKCRAFKTRNRWTSNVTLPQVRTFAALRKNVSESLHIFDFFRNLYTSFFGAFFKRIAMYFNKYLPKRLRVSNNKKKKKKKAQRHEDSNDQQTTRTDFEHATFLEACIALCFHGEYIAGTYAPTDSEGGGGNDPFAKYFNK